MIQHQKVLGRGSYQAVSSLVTFNSVPLVSSLVKNVFRTSCIFISTIQFNYNCIIVCNIQSQLYNHSLRYFQFKSIIIGISTITITIHRARHLPSGKFPVIIIVRCKKRRNKGTPRNALPPPSGQDGTTGSTSFTNYQDVENICHPCHQHDG